MENLKEVYKEKMAQYMERAEYIKKNVLSAPKHQIAPKEDDAEGGGGDGATAAAKKSKKK